MNWSAVYEYRFGDKLQKVITDIPGLRSVSFVYDGMGRRRNKYDLATEAMTWYRYDAGWNALTEYGPGGDPQTTWDIGTREAGHVYMGMTALAEIGGANPATGTTRHFAHDHLGSLRTAWGADRTLRARAEYLPYGEFLAGITDERIPASLFTGKSLDFETMLYHFPYRYYNPFAARWLTRDPLGMVDGPNVYAYVINSPIDNIDPLGQSIIVLLAGTSWLACCLKEVR